MSRSILLTICLLGLVSCRQGDPELQREVGIYLEDYTDRYQMLYYEAAKAEWKANTHIVEGDTATAGAVRRANEALAQFTGSTDNINAATDYLEQADLLRKLQVKQLESILYEAANNPQIVDSLVRERITLENELNNKLFGFEFTIKGEPVTTNDIDRILREELDPDNRLEAWEASKEVGKVLKSGLAEIRDLRNQTVQALGYEDFFAYQVSDYDMTSEEMLELMKQINRELYPLYRELHTYTRYYLAERYGMEEVPEMLPAHWLPNRWGQDWNAIVAVEGADIDTELGKKSAEDLVQISEEFYVSLGFDELPPVFWEKSSLYPLPPDADYKKNNHASAWHLDLDEDVRSLMSVEPNQYWYETTHHELGHIYYFISYSNPEVPLLLRDGANRAFHEAIGSLMGLASMQQPYLEEIGVMPMDVETDQTQSLLKEALNYIVFIPWSAGVMTEFEHSLYGENLPMDEFNDRWWELKRQYQGIAPPDQRGFEYADAASKTHIINDAAQYYDYALSYLILFQMHDHIAGNILDQDLHSSNYSGSE
ncbi:MAG: M2 family metallopeptidase, partial [Balneolaceae bacterium]|nr:M2 family metallopeptidase [Balneolaceae bacterium]